MVWLPVSAAHRAAGAQRRDRALVNQHAVAHRVGRARCGDRRFAFLLQRLEVGEEEQLVAPDRAAERPAEDVLVEFRRLVGRPRRILRQLQEVLVARGRRAARRPVAGAVVLVGSAAGDERDLRSARPSHLGVVVRRADAEFLQRFLGHADRRGVRRRQLRVVDVDAVERDALLVGARAGHRSVARIDRRRVGGRNEDRARLQAEQVHDVLRLDRQAANLLARHHVADARVGGIQMRDLGDDADRFRDAADFEADALAR